MLRSNVAVQQKGGAPKGALFFSPLLITSVIGGYIDFLSGQRRMVSVNNEGGKQMIVTCENDGVKFFLRGTTWAFSRERANEFPTREDAEKAITKAKPFMHKKILSTVKIEEN
jgi:hypothetical protein